MASPHQQEFRIRDLGTRSVLLFPSRAQIIRDIKDIELKPGLNKIIIDGLAPTVDEHSIKVEGTGAATISEVSVDLLPNRDVYEDIYPSESDDEDEFESESEAEHESMKSMIAKIKTLNDSLAAEREKINNANNRLNICDRYGQTISIEHLSPDKLPDVLKAYNEQRKNIFSDHQQYTAAAEKIEEEIAEAEKEKTRLAKQLVKKELKEQKVKKKAKDKAIRKKAELFREKQRIRAERESFWAKKVYRITISLETSNTLTPGSSRRSSIADGEVTNLATTTFHEPEALKDGSVSLSISYITYSACWSPRYDLNLSSLKCTGILEYSADLKNETSETWRDAKVILSTSQTSFSGLSEEIPILHPWHVRLVKGARNSDSALMSKNELDMKRKEWNAHTQSKPRNMLFGVDDSAQKAFVATHKRKELAKDQERGEKIDQLVSKANSYARQSTPFGAPHIVARSKGDGDLFGSFGNPITSASQFAGTEQYRRSGVSYQEHMSAEKEEECDEDIGFGLFDNGYAQDPNSLVFEEGAWAESGMTTTYDVPGLKTLAPSNSTVKHKIARIDFKNIIFSHIVIGKLRQVAFLKARLRNASKITLLKGPLGLSLDGSFLGQATFPRCSVGENFSLPLGVDPAIQVVYTKPTVHRSQSGIFTKEDSNVFTRSIIITNTKNAAVELTVLDQIPISEDERLRIEITSPRGLKLGSESVRTGLNASASHAIGGSLGKALTSLEKRPSTIASENGKEVGKQMSWGAAEATAKKGGEVAWNVKLNPGCTVKLALEYEAAFPGGESIVGV